MATPKPRKLKLSKTAAAMLKQMKRNAARRKSYVKEHNAGCTPRDRMEIPVPGATNYTADWYTDNTLEGHKALKNLTALGLASVGAHSAVYVAVPGDIADILSFSLNKFKQET